MTRLLLLVWLLWLVLPVLFWRREDSEETDDDTR